MDKDVTPVPQNMVRVQCIAPQGVWGDVYTEGKDGSNRNILRRIDLDEVVIIPKDAVFDRMRKNRHVVPVSF